MPVAFGLPLAGRLRDAMSILSLNSGLFCIAFQTSRPAGMCGGIALRGNGAGKLKAHQSAELEAMARAGRHHPPPGGELLDDEALVLGDGVEADLQPVGAPVLEAMEQAPAALEQRTDLVLACETLGCGVAPAAEFM